MKLKPVYLYSAIAGTFCLLFFAFGYFDTELAAERQLFGCALIIAGMAIVLSAMQRLRDDWGRLKPVHSVDLAFLQIAAGAGVLVFACVMGGRLDASIALLRDPAPQIRQATDQTQASGTSSTGTTGTARASSR